VKGQLLLIGQEMAGIKTAKESELFDIEMRNNGSTMYIRDARQ